MKKVCFWGALLAVLGFSTLANANLINNGNNLIYDTDLNITWYDDSTGYGPFTLGLGWAGSLSLGGTTAGEWQIGSVDEMSHLFSVEFNSSMANKGPFTNLLSGSYWTRDYWSRNPYSFAMYFNFSDGSSSYNYMLNDLYISLAVHEGNVGGTGAVPEPSTLLLLGGGLVAGLVAYRKKSKQA